jgi:AraC family transcriptional regulator
MHPTKPENPCCGHSSAQCRAQKLRVFLMSDPPGLSQSPSSHRIVVRVHVGTPTRMTCRRAGESFRGTFIHGDIDIIPVGTPSFWELKDEASDLTLCMPPEFLATVGQELGLPRSQEHIRNRFQSRDPQIEHIAWALKAETENGSPCGRLYVDSMAVALASQLLRKHGKFAIDGLRQGKHGLSPRRLRQIQEFIEENLSSDLSLNDIAGAAGLGLSQCKVLFRETTGLPIHQYLIRRRVERAAWLLRQGKMTASQIALESGFAHQSHLAMHMRRVLGASPKEFQRRLS